MHEPQWQSQQRTAQHDGSASYGLHQQVIRKNNEIIRNFLNKLNEVFARQEEYEAGVESIKAGVKSINEKLAKLAQSSDDLQYEFRATCLQNSRQQSRLNNDIAVLKNALKIPSLATPHEVYLSSDFFKERANLVNTRMRDHNGRSGLRQGVSGGGESRSKVGGSLGSMKQQVIFSNNQNSTFLNKHSENRSELPNRYSEEEETVKTSEPCILSHESSLPPQLQSLNLRLQAYATKTALQSSLAQLKEEMQAKISTLLAERKSECDWNHIDFDQIQAYIDGKVQEGLADKVSKKYFEASLINLKEAWQQEIRQIYAQISMRAETTELSAMRGEIGELCAKLQQRPLQTPLKTSTICLNNAVFSSFLGKHAHHRISVRDLRCSDSPDSTFIAKKEEESKKSRGNLQYSSSLSVCRSMGKKEARTAPIANCLLDDFASSQKATKQRVWRQKAIEALGEQKMKKKTKVIT